VAEPEVVTHLVEVPWKPGGAATRPDAELVLDVAVGIVGATVGAGVAVVRGAAELPVLRSWAGWHAPFVPARWQPGAVLADVAQRGAWHRVRAAQGAERLLDRWTPVIVERVVSRLDLTGIVTRHVDLDQVIKAVDLDAAVAGVDLDAVVQRIDLDAAVRGVDLDAAVAGVDLDAIAGRLDIDAVIDRVDLVAMVEEVIAAIDLPAIIRDSSGSMASETLRSARMTGISADAAIDRTVERHLFRRRRSARPDDSEG
jgi:hypothetical protein